MFTSRGETNTIRQGSLSHPAITHFRLIRATRAGFLRLSLALVGFGLPELSTGNLASG